MAARSTSGKTADVTAHDADATTEAPAEATEKATEKAPAAEEERSGTEYLNVSGGPIVYDAEGHQVADGEWITANLDKVGQAARRADYLKPRSAL